MFRAIEVFVALKINILQDVDIGKMTSDVEVWKKGLERCGLK